MNYTQLSAAIKAYVENDFPNTIGSGGMSSDDQIATFVRQAEQRIYSRVQLLALRKTTTLTCTAGNKSLSVPSDWLANFSIAVIDTVTGGHDFLLNVDVNYLREAFPLPTDQSKPTHYAFYDQSSFLLGPTPDTNYSMEVQYFYYPASIVDAGTSWLGTNFDSALLYGALLEAHTFMKGEADVLANYQSRYDDTLAMLKELGEGKNRQDMYRTPQVRYPVK